MKLRHLVCLSLLSACGDDGGIAPEIGYWNYTVGTQISNECGQQAPATLDGKFEITSAADGDFVFSDYMHGGGEYMCHQADGSFTCDEYVLEQKALMGVDITIRTTIRLEGAIGTSKEMIGNRYGTFTCEGSACADYLEAQEIAAVPCAYQYAFKGDR